MKIDLSQANYLKAAIEAVTSDPDRVSRWMSDICSECCEPVEQFGYAEDSHVFLEREESTPVVLIGCEGYLMINPNVLGIIKPNWQDWMTELENDNR